MEVEDNSVSGFCRRLEDIRKARQKALASDTPNGKADLEVAADKLATASLNAIRTLDFAATRAAQGETVTPRGCVTQHISELAVWGKPADLMAALEAARDQDITYIALACAVGANQHSAANTKAIVDAVIREPEGSPQRLLPNRLLKKIADRFSRVQACASTDDTAVVTPADFDAASLIEEKLSGSVGSGLLAIPRNHVPVARGPNGQG